MATKLHHYNILPCFSSSTPIQELTLPLTHFDIPFLQSQPNQILIFYEFSCSKPHFLHTILPGLKNSLSTTLSHFLPLAGNITVPENSTIPVIRYVSGDSVSLTVAQSDQDFFYLVGHHQRVADEFYPSVPDLPPATASPVMSFQITLFPDQGICIGLTFTHAVGDGSSMVNFVKSWAFINRFGEDFYRTDGVLIPVLDRNLVQDPHSLRSKAWNLVRDSFPLQIKPINFPINKFRSTFILTKDQVETLKNYASTHVPSSNHISSLAVIYAHIWTCAVKSDGGEDDGEPAFFMIPAECRRRLNPPLPAAYFGNCMVAAMAESRRGLLKGKEGFLAAVESIAEAIAGVLNGEGGIAERAKWPLNFAEYGGKCVMAVAGSTRFDFSDGDFGWGKARKHEFVHFDGERTASIAKSREFEGGFEIGVSRRKEEMDAFQRAFYQLYTSKI